MTTSTVLIPYKLTNRLGGPPAIGFPAKYELALRFVHAGPLTLTLTGTLALNPNLTLALTLT